MTTSPLVTIGVTTRNRSGPLRETIRSLLNQTWREFELLIADDASEDETRRTVESFEDPRIRYIRHERCRGAYANWNSVLREAAGTFVAVYHDHDYYAPDLIAKCVDVLMSNAGIGFVHVAKILCDASGRPRSAVALPLPDRMAGWEFARYTAGGFDQRISNFAMARTEVVRSAGFIDEALTLAADYDFWARVALKSKLVAYLREPLIGQLGRDQSSTLANYDRFAWISTEECLKCRRALIRRLEESRGRRLLGLRLRCYSDSEWLLSKMILQTVVYSNRFDIEAAVPVVANHGGAIALGVLWAGRQRFLLPIIRPASRVAEKLATIASALRKPKFLVPIGSVAAPDWFPAPSRSRT